MRKASLSFALLSTLAFAGMASAQNYPVLDKIADKVVAKYQNATCEQLWQQKSEAMTASLEEKRLIEVLKDDPQMQQEFFNRVAVPIATKMFQCGMIP